MVFQRCKGTDCTKFATKKKLVNQYQKAKGIDLLTLCTPCAKDLYPDYVGLECERADCTTAQEGGAFGRFCFKHSAHIPEPKPIKLVEELAENVKELTSVAISNIKKGKPVYAGLMGTSGEDEIRQDTLRMINQDSTLEKESHLAIYVDGNDKLSAHDVARDAERVLIRSIGVDRLLNKRQGGQGRPPA